MQFAGRSECHNNRVYAPIVRCGPFLMKWKPVDYIVAGLAILIISGMFVRLYAVAFMGKTPSQESLTITENILSGIMAIISMYVGAKIQEHRDKDK